MKLRGLYAITPDVADTELLCRKAELALAGGVVALQYRNKLLAKDKRLAQAHRLAALAHGYGVPFIVNDDLEIALAVGANGAHLGKGDADLRAARERLAGKILGASCYDRIELARSAVAAGADYVAFGSVFPSPTKPAAARAPLSLFAEAKSLGVPLAAIGGITLENAPQLLAAGADLLAVISDLFDAADVAARATQYARLFA
ncbi:MAG: thiamine-phosphate pyrophosphorylase [Burkholderiales bacterium]|nr:thiamine-phosphate pyrophosphorylase [Burkholderiales bacterium]